MKTSALFILLLFIINLNSFAQCSDAGVCSIGGHAMEEETTLDLSFGYAYGYSGKDDDISYSSLKLSGNYSFLKHTSFNFVVPFNFQSGPIADLHGIGDLILSLTQEIPFENSLLALSAGARLATATQDIEYIFTPQPYKSGLGSNDILFGVDYYISNFSFGVGYQIAGKPVDDDFTIVERGDDLLVRAGYQFNFDEIAVNPQLLFIKRLGESKMYFLNSDPGANSIPQFLEVPGSDQAQLNLLVNTTYNVSKMYSVFVEAAIPFLKRDVNVDGLTRAYSFSAGVKLSF